MEDYQVNVHFAENSFKQYKFSRCERSLVYSSLQKLIYDETEVSVKDQVLMKM
jgi:hypothetical protein